MSLTLDDKAMLSYACDLFLANGIEPLDREMMMKIVQVGLSFVAITGRAVNLNYFIDMVCAEIKRKKYEQETGIQGEVRPG